MCQFISSSRQRRRPDRVPAASLAPPMPYLVAPSVGNVNHARVRPCYHDGLSCRRLACDQQQQRHHSDRRYRLLHWTMMGHLYSFLEQPQYK